MYIYGMVQNIRAMLGTKRMPGHIVIYVKGGCRVHKMASDGVRASLHTLRGTRGYLEAWTV